MKHNRIILALSLIGLAVLILMLNFTSPTEVGPSGVLLFFTTFYVVVFGALVFVLRLFCRMAFSRGELTRRGYFCAAVAAFGPLLLLMVRSFEIMSWWTILLIVLIVGLMEFLVCKKFKI